MKTTNDKQVEALTRILFQRRDTNDVQSSPQKAKWTQLALDLFINQEEELPLSALPLMWGLLKLSSSKFG